MKGAGGVCLPCQRVGAIVGHAKDVVCLVQGSAGVRKRFVTVTDQDTVVGVGKVSEML